jgi:hypothetical protein
MDRVDRVDRVVRVENVPVGGKTGVSWWGYIVGKLRVLRCLSGPRLTHFEGRDKGIHAEEDSINP